MVEKSPKSPIPRVQRIRRQLSTGAWRDHFYHRPTKIRLPPPDHPSFAAAYQAAERMLTEVRQKEQRTARGVVSPPLTPKDDWSSDMESPGDTQESEEVYYTPDELVRRWRGRIDIETLANWRSRRQGPTYHRFGRAVLYRADLLISWESKNMIVCDPLAVTGREEDVL